MAEPTTEEIRTKVYRIATLGEALALEFTDGQKFGLGRDFAIATTNLETAMLWAVAGLKGVLKTSQEKVQDQVTTGGA